MRRLLATCAALIFLLGGCQWYGAAKEIAYDKAAELGNRYCTTRDPALQADLKTRINGGLRNAGASFEFPGVECDP